MPSTRPGPSQPVDETVSSRGGGQRAEGRAQARDAQARAGGGRDAQARAKIMCRESPHALSAGPGSTRIPARRKRKATFENCVGESCFSPFGCSPRSTSAASAPPGAGITWPSATSRSCCRSDMRVAPPLLHSRPLLAVRGSAPAHAAVMLSPAAVPFDAPTDWFVWPPLLTALVLALLHAALALAAAAGLSTATCTSSSLCRR